MQISETISINYIKSRVLRILLSSKFVLIFQFGCDFFRLDIFEKNKFASRITRSIVISIGLFICNYF